MNAAIAALLATVEPTHTIDVETVHGWVRLELTETQATALALALQQV